jgi:hypothetical protein
MAMPALGLGYPAANGTMAFVENFLPGLNLFRVPAIVRDVVRRVEPTESRGEALIFAAWIGLLGGFFIPRFGGFLGVFADDAIDVAIRNQLLVNGVAAGLVLVGAIFLVVLIWWIEARIARRRVAQLAGEGPAAAPERGGAVPVDAPAPSTPAPFAPAAAAVAPAAASVAPFAPPPPVTAPFAPAPQAAAPIPPAEAPVVPPAALATDALLHRPITAVTGAASIPTPVEAPTFAAEPMPVVAEPTFAAEPMPVVAPDTHVPIGPRLRLRIESATSMIATLDGESEVITLDELRAAAAALARADGSAVIQMAAATFEARALADRILETFTDSGVPTSLED